MSLWEMIVFGGGGFIAGVWVAPWVGRMMSRLWSKR